MVVLGSLDELRIGIGAHHLVAAGSEFGTHPAGTASGVEHPRTPRQHRVDQPCFAG
jgi:hypothetical protein